MKAKSAKSKGKRLELKVASMFREAGLKDVKVMPGSGAFQFFKGDLYMGMLPYHVECKNQETSKPWQWYEQSRSQAGMSKTPLVFFSRNHSQPMALLSAHDLIQLICELEEYKKLWHDEN